MKSSAEPKSFMEILSDFSPAGSGAHFIPRNETARLLDYVPSQSKMNDALMDMGQKKFVSLAKSWDDATISMALYAGDGIVTKITPEGHTAKESLPLVLPAFAARHVDLGDERGSFTISSFPFLDTRSISEKDVETMRQMLDAHGLRFAEQDDKPNNIGRLADGSLAVLDAGAVILKPDCDRAQLRLDAAKWERKIERLYPAYFSPGFTFSQSEKTDFALKPLKSPAPEVPALTEKHRSWRKLFGDRKSSDAMERL